MSTLQQGDVATAMPSGLALAASFDADLARVMGVTVGTEVHAKGFNVLLSGGINLARCGSEPGAAGDSRPWRGRNRLPPPIFLVDFM